MRMSRRTSLAVIWAAYLWTIAVSWAIASFLPVESPLVKALVIDVIATVMVFAFSAIFNNSSFYDPFWSVAPIFLAGFWTMQGWWAGSGDNWRAVVVTGLVALWGIRLTTNFLTRWRGMRDEDWRYEAFRENTGSAYWVVSFFGFHLAPTLIVFAACVPVFFACTSQRPFGLIDVIATVVTTLAIIIETVSDAQMRSAVARDDLSETTFRGGLWKYSRHPNYFGEVLFWWGLYCFALGAGAEYWWTIFGPLGVTALFLFVSLPLIEDRMQRRRPDYEQVRAQVSALIPWPPKKT
jgi:steroid 5-alpha reductase family enzyme